MVIEDESSTSCKCGLMSGHESERMHLECSDGFFKGRRRRSSGGKRVEDSCHKVFGSGDQATATVRRLRRQRNCDQKINGFHCTL